MYTGTGIYRYRVTLVSHCRGKWVHCGVEAFISISAVEVLSSPVGVMSEREEKVGALCTVVEVEVGAL